MCGIIQEVRALFGETGRSLGRLAEEKLMVLIIVTIALSRNDGNDVTRAVFGEILRFHYSNAVRTKRVSRCAEIDGAAVDAT